MPSECVEEESVPCLSQLPVTCWPSLAFLGLQKHPPNLCLHLHRMFSFCVSFANFSFVTTPAALEQGRASEFTAFAATLFPNKVRSEVLRVRPQHMNMDADTVHSGSHPALQGRHYCSLQ